MRNPGRDPCVTAGVIGFPVAQSLSPRLHGHWLNRFGLSGRYLAREIAPHHFVDDVHMLLEGEGWAGMNVTLPHKEAAYDLVDQTDDDARRLGAVNTIIRLDSGALEGRNTDLYGFRENIQADPAWSEVGRERAVILGAGGAARAVAAAIQDWGFASIMLVNRSRDRADRLVESLGLDAVDYRADLQQGSALETVDLLVNTTSLGMEGQPPLEISLDGLPKTALVTDIVYKPLRTDLLRRAAARGNPTVDGLGMLLHQAVPGFQAWFSPPRIPPVDAELRRVVLEGLRP